MGGVREGVKEQCPRFLTPYFVPFANAWAPVIIPNIDHPLSSVTAAVQPLPILVSSPAIEIPPLPGQSMYRLLT